MQKRYEKICEWRTAPACGQGDKIVEIGECQNSKKSRHHELDGDDPRLH
jgi:hypothetical protein